MSARVPLNEAARELGVAPQSVREHMRRGIWDLGLLSLRSGKEVAGVIMCTGRSWTGIWAKEIQYKPREGR